METQWAVSIDIEGFSKNYEHSEERKTFAIRALGELMQSIYSVATNCYPGDPCQNFTDRLFAHQFGDGFLICSAHGVSDLERAVAISAAIMRHMLLHGYATKAAISMGSMSDIHGCYPKDIRDGKDNRIYMGTGLMTVISVMGTALTKAHKLASTRSGAVLVIDQAILDTDTVTKYKMQSDCLDWITTEIPLADEIAQRAGLFRADSGQLLATLRAYCNTVPKPPISWVDATFSEVRE